MCDGVGFGTFKIVLGTFFCLFVWLQGRSLFTLPILKTKKRESREAGWFSHSLLKHLQELRELFFKSKRIWINLLFTYCSLYSAYNWHTRFGCLIGNGGRGRACFPVDFSCPSSAPCLGSLFHFHSAHGLFSCVLTSASISFFFFLAVGPFCGPATVPLSSHRQHNRGSVGVWQAVRLGQDHFTAPETGSLLLWCLIINSISTTQCFRVGICYKTCPAN